MNVVSLGLGAERNFGKVRFRVLLLVVGLAFSVLVTRLYVLQVRRHQEFRQKSESNFVQLRRVEHERGIMKDRDGRVLVDNRPSHDVTLTPAFMPDPRAQLQRLFRAAGISRDARAVAEEITARLERGGDEPILLQGALRGSSLRKLEETLADVRMSGLELRDGAVPEEKDLLLNPAEFPSKGLVIMRLAELLELGPDGVADLRHEVGRVRGLNRFVPVVVRQNLPWELYARIAHSASLGELPGVDVVESVTRDYREGPRAAHLLGYMNEISPQELEQLEPQGYLRGDALGRRGLERTFERMLRGSDGQEKVVVDAKGRRIKEDRAVSLLGEDRVMPPVSGQSLVLTLDMDMQRAAETAFRGKAGAVVAVEVATGSVLVLASFPSYDPNVVSGRMSGEQKRRLDTDPLQPWINKAIQQHYAPGSTFKILTAIAGLKEGRISPDTYLPCPGFFALGRTQWRCFNRGGHGAISLRHSIQVSCDAYYYRLGYNMGADALARHGREFGFGSRSGIPLDGEIPGIMPDQKYYEKRFGSYQGGYVVNNAIGQGDVAVTPLQLAMAYAAVVNGGILLEPRLVQRTEDRTGKVLQEFPPRERRRIELPGERAMQDILGGMSDVVKPGGTAAGVMWQDNPPGLGAWLRTAGVTIAGKTGTAQVARLSKSVAHADVQKTEYLRRDHAWFAGFAPAEKPEIVVVTLTEHGGFGGSMSAPVSAAVMRAYFEKKGFATRPEKDWVRAVKAAAPVVAPEHGHAGEAAED